MKYLFTFILSIFLIGCTAQTGNIQTIEYEAGPCFGYCPIFKMTINPDRTAVIEAERFTFTDGRNKDDFSRPKEGTFKATINQYDYNQLVKLLNDANLKSLKDYYGNENITDLPTADLTVTYKDGTSKHIEDYGKSGTPKLDKIYEFLENLRKTQAWTKVK